MASGTTAVAAVGSREREAAGPGRRAGVNFLYGAAGAGAAAALHYLVALLVARGLGRELYGEYAFALALAYMAALPGDCGLHLLAVREVADRPAAAGAIFRSAVRAKLPLGVLSGALAAALWSRFGGQHVLLLPFMLLWLADQLACVWALCTGCFRGLRRMDLEFQAGLAQACVLVAGVGIALGVGAGLSGCFVAWLASHAVATGLCLRAGARVGLFRGGPGSLAEGAVLTRRALPLAAGALGTLAQQHLPVLFLATAAGAKGTPAAVGAFAAALGLIKYGLVLEHVAVGALVPHLVPGACDRRRVGRMALACIVPGLAASGAVWAAAPWVIGLLYGSAFAPASDLLRVMAPVPALLGIECVAHAWLLANGRTKVIAGALALSTMVLAAVLWLLAGRLGATGAACAVVAAQLACTLALTAGYLARRSR